MLACPACRPSPPKAIATRPVAPRARPKAYGVARGVGGSAEEGTDSVGEAGLWSVVWSVRRETTKRAQRPARSSTSRDAECRKGACRNLLRTPGLSHGAGSITLWRCAHNVRSWAFPRTFFFGPYC